MSYHNKEQSQTELPKQTEQPPATAIPKPSERGKKASLPSSDFLLGKSNQQVEDPKNTEVKSKPINEAKGVGKGKKGRFYLTGVSPEKIEFSLRHLSLMLRTGMSLTDGLEVTIDQADDERLKSAYEDIMIGVQQGKSLSVMMQKYPNIFSGVVISIIQVSEDTGTLEKNLLFLADYLKKNYELNSKVKGALIYPIIVLGLTIAEMLGVIFFILPKLEVMFASFEHIPAFSLFVVNVARMFRDNVVVVSIVAVVLLFVFSRLLKTRPGRKFTDKLSISFPIIKKLTKSNILGSFCRTLGMLLETGIPISAALEISAKTTPNSYYAQALVAVSREVKGGKNLAASLLAYRKYFPISLIKIISAGEKTGTLEDNLAYMYDSYSNEVEEMANNMVTLIEPLLLIFAGAMIGMLAITIIAPIYQFTSTINN